MLVFAFRIVSIVFVVCKIIVEEINLTQTEALLIFKESM